MWIVRLALSRPYTFVVMSLLIAVMGVLAIMTMSVDIFPKINIPVVSSIWSYGGLSPTEMQNRITTIVERALTTTVSNIEHIESQSVRGNSVIKMYFQPGTDINGSVAQVTALSQTIIKPLPPGITPPLILQYNAANVPVIMLSLGSDQLSEQELSDLGNNFIRTQLVAVQGAAVPLPYGGKTRVVNVDVDSDALYARGLSPQDVVNAMQLQNLTVAPGTAKMGPIEYDVAIDSSPAALDDLNNIPIKYVNGTLVYVRDVGFVHDGYQPQTNLVRRDGRHSVLIPVLTSGSASTLSVVSAVRNLMPTIMAGMPKSLNLDYLFDQSVFVRASISGVVHEGVIAACLTGLMILVFLGSWRSTLIVTTSIPLSILASISVLYIFGETLNVMTLGGLALAVGILVDDATVEIENNHRHLDMGKAIKHAILDGASEVATPAVVATLSICIVFVPIFLLTGVGGFLFAPLAMSVVFAVSGRFGVSGERGQGGGSAQGLNRMGGEIGGDQACWNRSKARFIRLGDDDASTPDLDSIAEDEHTLVRSTHQCGNWPHGRRLRGPSEPFADCEATVLIELAALGIDRRECLSLPPIHIIISTRTPYWSGRL